MPLSKGRLFPTGDQILGLARSVSPLTSLKPLRRCESYWASRGLNVRSTLWNGPRGGAPFTAACLALLARTSLACWPWSSNAHCLLVEAFPAAQLRHWNLPHEAYSGSNHERRRHRAAIIEALSKRLQVPADHNKLMLDSPDALDAVVAAFAAIAVRNNRLGPPPMEKIEEGWIAVHA